MKYFNSNLISSKFFKLSLLTLFGLISSCNQKVKQRDVTSSTNVLSMVEASDTIKALTPPIVKTIDKRTMTNSNGNIYFLVFIAKPTILNGGKNAGHAFVVWGAEDNTARMSYGEGWGLYPKNTMDVLKLSEVPGEIKNDGITSSNYSRLIIKVDKNVYDQALAKKKEWADKGTYEILTRDCLSFTIDIATIAKLTTPARTGFDNVPWQYLISLANAN